MEKNKNFVIIILSAVIVALSTTIIFFGIFYILNMQNKISKLEDEQKEQLKKQAEIKEVHTVEITKPEQQKIISNKDKTETSLQKTNKGIAITKEEGAYIRANFNTFFGRNEVCHNIGRNHVNFPAIYSGDRPDLSSALLRFIKKVDSNFIVNSNISDENNVMNWYTSNCVRYNAIGAQNSKTLRYFYEYVSNF